MNNAADSMPLPSENRSAASPTTLPSLPFVQRVAPAIGLLVLSPLVAEYLLGNISVSSLPWGLLFLAPMYGGAALLIREIVRRTGRGWESILLLAIAYGWFQAGILDQSLFNPSYIGQDFQSIAPIPGLGMSAYWAQIFITGHAVWSISVPIALIEAFVPQRSTTPWLGNMGLILTTFIFVFGCWIIFDDHQRTEQFMLSPTQLAFTATIILALIGGAFMVGRHPRPLVRKAVPQAWQVGVVAFLTASLFILRPENWAGVAFGFALIIGVGVLIHQWAKREGWNAMHRLALAGGALLTYAWVGFVATPLVGAEGMIKVIGNIVLAVGAMVLLGIAVYRVQKTATP
jgi:hypothetical protein